MSGFEHHLEYNSESRTAHPSVIAELRSVSKSFGGTLALDDVSIDLRSGEVLALLGENGAGKSTCVKLFAGVYRPDRGQIFLEGRRLQLSSPVEAQRQGIAVMHQHPGLFDDLSIAENIFIGRLLKNRWGILDHPRMREEAARLLEVVGLSADPSTLLGRLHTSERQLAEIAKALAIEARVLIMDEPTAALSEREVERLFGVVSQLRARRVAMMFVSHRMEEIYRVADRVAVLRDGRLVTVRPVTDLPKDQAVQLMVGRALSNLYPPLGSELGKTLLKVEKLTHSSEFNDVSFTVRAGEILGFGGLIGSGRTEVARVLFGVDLAASGTVSIDGRSVRFHSPADAMKAGIAYVSEDRISQSLIMDFGILANASLPVIDRATRLGIIQSKQELNLVKPHLDRMRLRFRSFEQPVSTLSGGNQQKVVLSKWLAAGPRIIIFDEPTQGIDVQTKAEVHAMIADLARNGIAIILISSELPELISMCHRVLVFREGEVTARFEREQLSQERIMYAATGTIAGLTDSSSPLDYGGELSAARPADGFIKPANADSRFRSFLVRRELGLFVAVSALLVPISALNPRMLSAGNLRALSMDAALLSIVAVGQMLVLITRNIDLSVASIIGLAAYLSADTLRSHPDLSISIAFAVAFGVGLACGLLNGLIVTFGRVPAIVVTLGTLALFRGLDSLIAHGKQISADQVPGAWLDLTSRSLLGVPGIVLLAAGVLVAIGFALRYISFGRELFAIGSNPNGAKLVGINAKTRVLGAFACGGLLAGLD
ncbi:MAG: ATP-binding cassette domain-containing protein, partial [Verrucomicrobia bacterium]|nr:ATP-binding cassette domain-containing protein [Verrucomicrobiota bacterium]